MRGEPKPAGWLIQKLDGLTPIFQRRVSIALQPKEIVQLLKCLAAQELTPSEAIDASLRSTMKAYRPLLEVTKESGRRVTYSVGHNPHFVASQFTEREFNEMDDLV